MTSRDDGVAKRSGRTVRRSKRCAPASAELAERSDGSARRAVHGNSRITRADVLDVAVRMFSARGYRATSLGDVAEELKVTRQAIYHYFDKKEDILLALFTDALDELERSLGELRATSPAERLREMLRAHLRVISKYPAHMNLVLAHQEALPSEIRHGMFARRWAYHRRFMAAYEECVAASECVDVPSDFAISVLLGAANVSARWVTRVGTVDPDSFVLMAEHFLANGYVSSAPKGPRRS